MAQINDLLVLGNSNLLGSVNVLGDLTKNGDGVITITALNTALANISYSSILNAPSALKNPNKLIFTGASTEEYDGSSEVSIHLVGWKGEYDNAEVFNTTSNKALGNYSHAQGFNTTASGMATHAEGYSTIASGSYAHVEGYMSEAKGNESHAEGWLTYSIGHASHTEGVATYTIGQGAHAEGSGVVPDVLSPTFPTVKITSSKANSNQVTVDSVSTNLMVGSLLKYNDKYGIVTRIDDTTHVTVQPTTDITKPNPLGALTNVTATILNGTTGYGWNSHAEGQITAAIGQASHSEGMRTVAVGRASHVEGKFNILDSANVLQADGTYVHIIGNGTSESARSNAHTIDWQGNAWFQGDVYTGSTSGTNKDSGSVRLAKTTEVVMKPASTTANTIARYSNTTGDIKSSGILIEDVTNTRDTSKKAYVMSIPAEGGKKMVYGYCTDQVDGTSFIGGVFDANATTFPYAAGLAIGGSSGNLLWKANRVLTTADGWNEGQVNRHVYLTGAKESSSTGNTSQIVFGTPTDEHVALSSNTAMFVINPSTSSASNQILLKLATYSTFPKGIKVTTEAGLTPSESLLRNSKLVSTATNPSMSGEICWQYE